MSTSLSIHKQIPCLLQLATCFVFYTKAVFSLNYYYTDRSTLRTATAITTPDLKCGTGYYLTLDKVTKRTTDAHKRIRVSYINSMPFTCFGKLLWPSSGRCIQRLDKFANRCTYVKYCRKSTRLKLYIET